MEFLGSKGKWYQSHRQIPNDEDGMYATQIYTEDGETIATLSWYPKPKEKVIIDGKPMIRTGTYREANALLISKSPEMLEMLKNVLKDNHCTPDLDNEIQQLIKEATTLK